MSKKNLYNNKYDLRLRGRLFRPCLGPPLQKNFFFFPSYIKLFHIFCLYLLDWFLPKTPFVVNLYFNNGDIGGTITYHERTLGQF